MNSRILSFILISLFLFSCENTIKNNSKEVVVENGTEVTNDSSNLPIEQEQNIEIDSTQLLLDSIANTLKTDTNLVSNTTNFLGFWVGYFKKDVQEEWAYDNDKDIYADEGFIWTRENKINISIDTIIGNKVIGHSVVAGNNRPFIGTISPSKEDQNSFDFFVKEPGAYRYQIMQGGCEALSMPLKLKNEEETQKVPLVVGSSFSLSSVSIFLPFSPFLTTQQM